MTSRHTASYFPDLVHIVYAIRRFRVPLLDVQVQVASKRGRGEGLVAVWAALVLGRF